MNILCGRHAFLATEDMAEMGGVGKATLPCGLENGDLGEHPQQSLGLLEPNAHDIVSGGLAGGFLDATVELAGADGNLGGQCLDIDLPFLHILLQHLGKLSEQLFVAVVFYAHRVKKSVSLTSSPPCFHC